VHLTTVRIGERIRDTHGDVTSLVISQLEPGAHVLIRTTNSVYEFWAEYPEQAVGILRGGTLACPTRVRLSAETAASMDASVQPLTVGERARVVLLGPSGNPVRGFVTSMISQIRVGSGHQVAA
jgi:hypothetical protein